MTTEPTVLAHLRHELRTPLNHIIGYSEMLLEEAGERGWTELEPGLHQVHENARQLLGLINDFLAPSRIKARAVNLGRMPAELAAPLDQIIAASENLKEQAIRAGAEDLLPDLERISLAAGHLLTLIRQGVAPPSAERPAVDMPRVQADAAAPSGERGAILVVDDNESNRDMLSRRLARQGYHVQVATGGRLALEALQIHRVDLVLLDVMMPEMDGYDVLQRLKSDPALRDIPVLMISALDEIDSVVRCIELGAEDYLPKPFDPVLLRARIGACLEKKRLRDQELLYLKGVARVTSAAAAVEAGQFEAEMLTDVAKRPDELGQLARVFQRMAREVLAREEQLKQQIQTLRIEIDQVKKASQVSEITGTEYFQDLQKKAKALRDRSKT